MKQSQDHAGKFKRLKAVAEGKYAKRVSIMEETRTAKKLVAEEESLKKRIVEIARSVYGEKWKPPLWGWQP